MFKRFTQDICFSDYDLKRDFRNQIGLAGTNTGLQVETIFNKGTIKVTPRDRSSESFIIFSLIAATLLPIFTITFFILTIFFTGTTLILVALLASLVISSVISYPLVIVLNQVYNKSVRKNNPEEYSKENLEKNNRLYSDVSKLPTVELDIKIADDPRKILKQYEAIILRNMQTTANEKLVSESNPDLFKDIFEEKDSESK